MAKRGGPDGAPGRARERSLCQLPRPEWGVPVHDDRTHFEFLILEGAGGALRSTILNKREPTGSLTASTREGGSILRRSRSSWRTRASCATGSRYGGGHQRRACRGQKEFEARAGSGRSSGSPSSIAGRTSRTSPRRAGIGALSLDLKKRGFKFVGAPSLRSHAGGGDGERSRGGLLSYTPCAGMR
jgi:DNA-3-methyladenine glycosylase I